MRLVKLCIALFFALTSISFSNSSYPNNTEQVITLNENDDYTIVREYHDGLWWLVYYDVDGLKVMEVPDPWQ
jgi:hypothetical protein